MITPGSAVRRRPIPGWPMLCGSSSPTCGENTVYDTQSGVTAEHVRRFQEDGFFVLENIVPQHDLQALRVECQRFIGEREAEMDRLGVDVLDLDHRGSRYF